MSEKDKYDEAIDWLVEHAGDEPSQYGTAQVSVVHGVWCTPSSYKNHHLNDAHCLFQFTGPNGSCGCLTQIRNERMRGPTPELTEEIRADDRIPVSVNALADLRDDELRAALQPFAEWQRRLDREIRQGATA